MRGVALKFVDVIHVPGSFEIPLTVKRVLQKRKYHAIITVGVVIRGQTRHFEHVADAAASGTMTASLQSNIPVIYGVVTAENTAQAIDRIGGKMGHKGRQAVQTALEMANLLENLTKS